MAEKFEHFFDFVEAQGFLVVFKFADKTQPDASSLSELKLREFSFPSFLADKAPERGHTTLMVPERV